MSDLYKRIETLCDDANVNITTMCKEAEVSRASLTDLKMGRKQSLSADTLSKIASYFGVSVDYLLGNEPKGKAPSKVGEGHRPPDEETLHLLEVLENRPDIRYLAAASERATPEHVKATAKMFDELYGRGNDK